MTPGRPNWVPGNRFGGAKIFNFPRLPIYSPSTRKLHFSSRAIVSPKILTAAQGKSNRSKKRVGFFFPEPHFLPPQKWVPDPPFGGPQKCPFRPAVRPAVKGFPQYFIKTRGFRPHFYRFPSIIYRKSALRHNNFLCSGPISG